MTTMTFILSSFLWITSNPIEVSHFERVNQFLMSYVDNGRVDYDGLVENSTLLNQLYGEIATMDLSNKSGAFEKAFYINAYNIIVIKQVVDMYPLKSPLENPKFFNGIKHTVAGKKLTLDGIEKGTLLKKYPDPRIHFAVVCAAIGCPPIHNAAFTPENVENLLDDRTRNAMNDDYFTRFDGKKLELSQIFNWYNGDFKSKGSDLIDFVNQYRSEHIPSGTPTLYYEYDWNLNKK